MSEPWSDYASPAGRDVQTDGPWSDYDMTGPADRAPRKKTKSLSLGFMEGVYKPVEHMNRASPLHVFDSGLVRETSDLARKDASNYFAKREQTEKPAQAGVIAGNIVGTLPAMLATKNPFIAGAAQGALLTDAKDPQGVAVDAGIGAVTNWFGGKAVDAAADFIKPAIEPAARRLAEAGVKLTPGMVKGEKAMVAEDKRMSRPIVGDAILAGRQKTQETFNTATVNRALEPLGLKVPSPIKPGHDAVDWAHQRVSDAYDMVVPNLSVNINGPAFAQKLLPTASALPDAQRAEFQRLISLHLKNGQLQGQALKDAQGEIRRLSSVYGRSQSAADHELGRALGEVDDELSAAMMAQNPKWAPELQKINAAYKGMMVVEGAAKGADEGMFSTVQLKTAVRQGDRSKGKTQTARGKAFMQDFSEDARKVIPARVPDSGTSGRNQASNLFARLGGTAELGVYRGDELLQQLRLLPRPQQAEAVAGILQRLQAPFAAGAVATAEQPSN